MQNTHNTPSAAAHSAHAEDAPLSGALILLLASGAGLAVASIYYSQPMLGILSSGIGATDRQIGLVPMLTQLGYALGILFLAPLGDRFDRRRIILLKAAVLTAALVVAGAAQGIGMLLIASFVVGISATLAQDIVPAAAALAAAAHRGKVVGKVMTGLLMGILLSRVVSGFAAEHLGLRTVFIAAAVSIAAIGTLSWFRLPTFHPTSTLSYRALMGSLASLWRAHPALRRAAGAQGLMSIGFSAFWSTLAVMLHQAPFHLGSEAAGAFGLAGAAGALAAPVAGKLADKHGPGVVTRLGTGIAALSFALMSCAPWLSPSAQLWLLGIGAIGFDLGIQATLIAHQTIIYSIDPGARSRLNAVLFVSMFICMSIGAAVGSLLLAQWGWVAVTGLATLTSLMALGIRCLAKK